MGKLRKKILAGTPNILDEPTSSKSQSALIMLNRYFSKLDPTSKLCKAISNFHQAKYNTRWIKQQKRIYGKLVCAYCGHPVDLYKHAKKSNGKLKLATVDHFIPIFLGGGRLDRDNFVVACEKCNGKKGADLWPITSLKFYYGPLKNNLTYVPEIKWSISFYIPFGFSIFAPQLQTYDKQG